MSRNRTLVIATRNKGKSAEIRDLLNAFPVAIKDLDDFGPIPPVVEDGETFDENAYKKASFVSRVLGLPALADDSGLVVEALDGAPGVHSARYAGENASDAQRCAKLLAAMKGKTNRWAAFNCVISIAVPTGPARLLLDPLRDPAQAARQLLTQLGFGLTPRFLLDSGAPPRSLVRDRLAGHGRNDPAAVDEHHLALRRPVDDG